MEICRRFKISTRILGKKEVFKGERKLFTNSMNEVINIKNCVPPDYYLNRPQQSKSKELHALGIYKSPKKNVPVSYAHFNAGQVKRAVEIPSAGLEVQKHAEIFGWVPNQPRSQGLSSRKDPGWSWSRDIEVVK